jgi:hypothetical protein
MSSTHTTHRPSRAKGHTAVVHKTKAKPRRKNGTPSIGEAQDLVSAFEAATKQLVDGGMTHDAAETDVLQVAEHTLQGMYDNWYAMKQGKVSKASFYANVDTFFGTTLDPSIISGPAQALADTQDQDQGDGSDELPPDARQALMNSLGQDPSEREGFDQDSANQDSDNDPDCC